MCELNVFKVLVVVVIDGNCFGVGLEFVLVCDYCIVFDEVYI